MNVPLGNRLNEAESQQTQAEREVAAQFDAIRRELALENEAVNTAHVEVCNMKHLIKAVTCRDWCDLRQNGAFSNWDCDKLTCELGKRKIAAPVVDDTAIKQRRFDDKRDSIQFVQKMLASNRPFSAQRELFRIVDACVHPNLAQVASAQHNSPCELAYINFEYMNNDALVIDAPIKGAFYVKLVNKNTLRFSMKCGNAPCWAKFDKHFKKKDDSGSEDEYDDRRNRDWKFEIDLSAGEGLSKLQHRQTVAAMRCPLYVSNILGDKSVPRWPCIILSMLVYTSSATNPLTDRTCERIRTRDFRNAACILKPFFDIDANPNKFLYPFFEKMLLYDFYRTIRPMYDKSLFYISD